MLGNMKKDTGISLNKYVNKILKEDEDVKSKVGDRIFPLIANEDTKFPFIYHTLDNVEPTYCKDGRTMDQVTFAIIVRDNKYMRAVEIAEAVRWAFENRRDNYFLNVELQSVDEAYIDIDDTFRIDLIFTARLK